MTTTAERRPVPPAYQGARLDDVDLFIEGNHRGEDWTAADLADMVRNFGLTKDVIKVPFVLGHEEKQLLTGVPAAGWLDGIRQSQAFDEAGLPAALLKGDLSRIRPDVASWIAAGAYDALSLEVYGPDDLPREAVEMGCKGPMVRRACALGGEQPQLKRLGRLPMPTFSELRHQVRPLRLTNRGRKRSADGKCWQSFSEVKPMDRNAMEQQLRGLSWTDEMLAPLASLDDDAFAQLTMGAMAAAAGVAPAPETPAPEEPGTEPPPGDVTQPPDRATMIADLVAMGQDQAALEAMDDTALAALWQEKKGGAVPMSEPANPFPETPSLTQPSEPIMPTPTTPTLPTPARPASPAPGNVVQGLDPAAVKKLTVQFSEIQRQNATILAQQQLLLKDQSVRLQREREATVRSYCERWARESKVLPSDVDPRSTTDNLYHQLMRASASKVLKFGEKSETEFAALVRSIDNRQANYVRIFAEKLPAEHGGQQAALSADERTRMLGHTPRGRAILAREAKRAKVGV